MNISLYLPEYLPTYWPGQNITGEVKIQLQNSSIKVTHLRIALFGNVQVYGDHPRHPMKNGLFDYQKNEQLINTGLRIVRISSPSLHQQQQQHPIVGDDRSRLTPQPLLLHIAEHQGRISHDDDNSGVIGEERQWRLYCRRDGEVNTEVDPQQPNNKKRSNKNQKTSEDRHIERLIRRVAAIDHTSNVCSGVLNDTTCSNNHEEAFKLNANSSTNNTIAFSIRVPKSHRLSGTFDHPHYPVSYRIVAIMKCRDNKNSEITCYSTTRLRLEPFVDIHAPQYSSSVQSSTTRYYVNNSNSLSSGVCTFLLSSSSVLNFWLYKLTRHQQQRKIAPLSKYYCSSYLQSHLELPKQQVFECSQYIPLELKFQNYAIPHFRISAIKIYVELVRRINMTCSMNEEVEGKAIESVTVLFKISEEEEGEGANDDILFFKHANMCFDLSKLIRVPDNCTCTITSESTKDVFSLSYVLIVRLDITGFTQRQENLTVTQSQQLQEEENDPYYYFASNKHLIQEEQQDNLSIPKESCHHKFKTYTLYLEPLTIVIGNSSLQ